MDCKIKIDVSRYELICIYLMITQHLFKHPQFSLLSLFFYSLLLWFLEEMFPWTQQDEKQP